MKRLIIIMAVCLMATALLAAPLSNADRLKQIGERQQQIVVEIDQRNAIIQQTQAQIDALRTEFLKLEGGKEELQRQDREAAQAKAEAEKGKPK